MLVATLDKTVVGINELNVPTLADVNTYITGRAESLVMLAQVDHLIAVVNNLVQWGDVRPVINQNNLTLFRL